MHAQVIATMATILAGVFLVPQIARLIRRRDTAGVSATWAAFGLVTNLAWVAYLGLLGLWIAAAAPGLAVVAYATVLSLLMPARRRWWLIVGGIYCAGLLVVRWFGSADTFGLALAGTPAIQLLPQVIVVLRERHPIGLSPVTWGIGVLEALLWLTYGSMVEDHALVGYGLVTTIGAGLVLCCWWIQLRRHQILAVCIERAPHSSSSG